MDKIKIATKLSDWMNEKEMYSELRNTPNGLFLCISDTREKKEIIEFLSSIGVFEIPFEWGFADEYMFCETCGKVICTTPQHAFWKPDFLVLDDGTRLCKDCIKFEDIVERFNHDANGHDTIFTKEEYEKRGWENYVAKRYGKEFVEEVVTCNDDLMEEASSYDYAIFCLVESTPFDQTHWLFVKNDE